MSIPVWTQFVDFMKWCLNGLVDFTGSPGLAIILFTIIIKLVLTPLTIKSLMSSRAMQNLQPQIRALQKRYGNDRQKFSAEQMLLYQRYKVNPLAGCLPVLFQLPIFWGLYQSIDALSKQSGGAFDQNFFWIPSLGVPDPLHILPFVAAFFQLIQTRMSMPTGKYKPTDPQQQMMTQMMQFLPLTVIIFGWSFPSGLVLYWATQSVFSAVQQYFITGWGALREWLPFLPEVNRWTPPDPDAVDESKVIVTGSGEPSAPATGGGLFGLLGRQMQKAEELRSANAATHGGDVTTAEADRPKDRQRIIVNNSTSAAARRTAQPADDDPDDVLEPVDDEAPVSRTSSRIIVTNSPPAKANGKRANADVPVPADGDGAKPATGGPAVPRKNRNRR